MSDIKYNEKKPYELVDVRNKEIPDSFELNINEDDYYISICPFVWMRPWEGLEQSRYTISSKKNGANVECEFFYIPVGYHSLTMNTLKVDIIEKVDKLGYSHFQKLVSDWCGRSAELKSKIKSTDVEEQKRRSDAKAEGYEYIVSAYVHLESGGDDQRVSWFAKEKPSTLSVQNQLKKLKSIELNDYSIENI